MKASGPREKLYSRTREALARYGRAQAEIERRCGQPTRPGDLFVFAATAEHTVQWAALERHPRRQHRWLVIPADLHPQVGSADVAVPASSSCGALSLRCRFGVWLDAGDFDLEMRTGFLEPEVLAQARWKHAAIGSGHPVGSEVEREVDTEPEYQDLEEELKKTQAALGERPRGKARYA